MASNDYYRSKPLPDLSSGTPEPSPYYSAYNAPSTTPYSYGQPPSYASQQNLGPSPDARTNQPAGAGGTGPSPFETVFDDHVYPMNPGQSSSSSTANMADRHGDGGRMRPGDDYHRQQESGYYGLGRMQSDDERLSGGGANDDIPLQNRPHFKDSDMHDHVYDAGSSAAAGVAGNGAPTRGKSRRGKIRFGELGMLTNGKKKIPWVCYIFSIIQVGVFIGEIANNATLTGSPIMIKPQFNPMIGPSTFVLVNMGSRYVACMHDVEGVQNSPQVISWPCPNTTTTATECSLSQLCGFGGVSEPLYGSTPEQRANHPQPNQWFRFIIPMFLHAGLIHIGFNLLLQLTIGREMEQTIGSIRFFLVYISAGIFGFVMGGNFAGTGISSTGASGSLFGIIALTLIDLLYSWKDRRNPVKDLMFIGIDVVISFVLGLLPGLDNFSHIGGFLMGLALGVCLLHSPNSLRRRIGVDAPPYATVGSGQDVSQTPPSFFRNPVGFFKGRKPLWWVWWLIRAGALVLVTVVFILLLQNFYVYHNTCSWCKYLSCLPINDWCEMTNLIQKRPAKRDLLTSAANLFL